MLRLKARLDRLEQQSSQSRLHCPEAEHSPCYRAQLDAVIEIMEGNVPLGVYPPNLPVEYRRALIRSVKRLQKQAARQKVNDQDYQRLTAWFASMIPSTKNGSAGNTGLASENGK